AATETGRKARREKAGSTEAGGRGQAKGRAEAGREKAGQARSDRGSHQEGREEAAAKAVEQQKPKERTFDSTKIAALLDKREPSHQAATGDTLNSNAALGTTKGTAADNSATWGAMFQQQVERCWNKPMGALESQHPEAAFTIRLRRDGTLEAAPVPEGTPATPYLRVYQESALRAIVDCQPYHLPPGMFEEWKFFSPVFTERRS